MVGATFVFALMGALIKHVSAWHSAFEVVFYRGAVSALLMGAWIYASGRSVRTRRIGLHASRSLLGTTAMAWSPSRSQSSGCRRR